MRNKEGEPGLHSLYRSFSLSLDSFCTLGARVQLGWADKPIFTLNIIYKELFSMFGMFNTSLTSFLKIRCEMYSLYPCEMCSLYICIVYIYVSFIIYIHFMKSAHHKFQTFWKIIWAIFTEPHVNNVLKCWLINHCNLKVNYNILGCFKSSSELDDCLLETLGGIVCILSTL